MKSKFILLLVVIAISTMSAKAQFVVTDPANIATSIVNSANQIVQTSSTVSNVIKNFQEVKKVYEQGKEYYDKLKAVHNLVQDARKVKTLSCWSVKFPTSTSTVFKKCWQTRISAMRN